MLTSAALQILSVLFGRRSCADRRSAVSDARGGTLDAVPDKGKDKSFNYQDITPKELQPAVTAIRKAFDNAS